MIILRKFKSLLKIIRWHVRQRAIDRRYLKSEDYAKLSKLRGDVRGDVGFLIGNGPSVRTEDLDQLIGLGTSFCCNRFYLAYDQMEFRPTFTLSGDTQVVEDFGKEIIENSESTVLFTTESNLNKGGSIWLRSLSRGSSLEFQKKKLARVTPGGGTLLSAMQIGYFLGIRKFFLYGVDHHFKFEEKDEDSGDAWRRASGEGNHFIKNYRSGRGWCPPASELIENSFLNADQRLRKEGGFVKNATRGGKLEVLERVEFDDFIKELGELSDTE